MLGDGRTELRERVGDDLEVPRAQMDFGLPARRRAHGTQQTSSCLFCCKTGSFCCDVRRARAQSMLFRLRSERIYHSGTYDDGGGRGSLGFPWHNLPRRAEASAVSSAAHEDDLRHSVDSWQRSACTPFTGRPVGERREGLHFGCATSLRGRLSSLWLMVMFLERNELERIQ